MLPDLINHLVTLTSPPEQHDRKTEGPKVTDCTAFNDKELISHLPKLYNRTQRRDMHRTPFTIRELNEVLYKLQPGKTQGVDRLPAELYRRLPLNLKRHLAARLWDIAIGKTDVPPDWANLVHPLYKKGDPANSDNWRPIVCATTDAKLIWMLIIKRVAPAVYRAVPPTMWGAIPGRSPLEAIFMQDAVVDMDPISLIITSLDVKGASPNTPHRLLRAVWEHMGLPFEGFLQAYLATRMYAIKPTWAPPHGSTPPVGSHKGVRKAHSSSYSSPSRWRFTSDARTRTWHHIPYGPRS